MKKAKPPYWAQLMLIIYVSGMPGAAYLIWANMLSAPYLRDGPMDYAMTALMLVFGIVIWPFIVGVFVPIWAAMYGIGWVLMHLFGG